MTAVDAEAIVSAIVHDPHKLWIAGGRVIGYAAGRGGQSIVITGHYADPAKKTAITVEVNFYTFDLLRILTPFTAWDPELIPELDREIRLHLAGRWNGTTTSLSGVRAAVARPLIMMVFGQVWPQIVSRSLPASSSPEPFDEITRTLREDFWQLLGTRFSSESTLGYPRSPEKLTLKFTSNGRTLILTLTSERRSSKWKVSKLEVGKETDTMVEVPIPPGAFDKTLVSIISHALKQSIPRTP